MKSILRSAAALCLAAVLTVAPLSASAASSTGFPDVPDNAWYTADVKKAVELGLMKGKGDGRFDPQGKLSVAEAITMAVQLHSRLYHQSFTPGGNPWYRNALTYAQDHGLVLPGEFRDYTAPATRAQMAGLFAFTLPYEMCQRINRVPLVPDVKADDRYADAIYLLYQIGVLAGTGGGAFQPDTNIDRASAAAILNRTALPESRVSIALPTPAGTVVENADKAFRFTFTSGKWEAIQDQTSQGIAYTDGSAGFTARSFDRKAADLSAFATGQFQALGLMELLVQPNVTLFRGNPSVSWQYVKEGVIHSVFCMETSANFVMLDLTVQSGPSASVDFDRLLTAAYTLDLAL